MVIYAFIQMFNESQTGNLKRCLENVKEWADDIIIYDDKSTDDSVELAKKYTNNIILGDKNEWTKETFNKQKMLNYIHNMKKKPDWILWVDCDEILDNTSVKNIKKFCEDKYNGNVDAYALQQINLWRSEIYYRTDGALYGEKYGGAGWFIRLWKYNENLKMNEQIGADQRLYPINIKNIEPCDFKIIHYGFSNYKQTMKHIGVHLSTKEQLIDTANGDIYVKLANEGNKWAENYVVKGKGVPNMFLNEENLTVKICDYKWFKSKMLFDNTLIEECYNKPEPLNNNEIQTYDKIKENILFMGNCQMRVIKDYCAYYLKKKMEYLNIVYDLENESSRVNFLIKNADIIITQPFYEGKWFYSYNKIVELKNSNCYVLKVHCLYYDGYFPYMNINNYENLENNDELKNKIIKNSENSFMNLHERENGLKNYIKIDVPILDFVKNNYKNKRLFLRENHPNNYLMNYYAYLIYKQIYNDNSYFQKYQLVNYNKKFDTDVERLNAVKDYLKIDELTKETLELLF